MPGQELTLITHKDLSANESIEAVVEIVDAELIRIKEYASMGKNPADRERTLLGKLDSMRRNKERGYNLSEEIGYTSHKFMGRVENICRTYLSNWNDDLFSIMTFHR